MRSIMEEEKPVSRRMYIVKKESRRVNRIYGGSRNEGMAGKFKSCEQIPPEKGITAKTSK